jgi:hypothetical protein
VWFFAVSRKGAVMMWFFVMTLLSDRGILKEISHQKRFFCVFFESNRTVGAVCPDGSGFCVLKTRPATAAVWFFAGADVESYIINKIVT